MESRYEAASLGETRPRGSLPDSGRTGILTKTSPRSPRIPEMKISTFPSLLIGCCLALLVVHARAADWPQWRGPNRDGISHESGLVKEWPADGPKAVWKV